MGAVQPALWAAAFGVAVALFARESRRGLARFVFALWAGALFAHLGWGLLHLPGALRHPESLLQPAAASALFVPLGLLVCAPWRQSLAALPAALGVARLGCLPQACCYGGPWLAAPELAGLAALHAAARRWPQHAGTLVLCGLGALRLAVEPLRVAGPGTFVDPRAVALAWIAAGLVLGPRIGSVHAADLASPRVAPLARPLGLMLAVWAAFPVAGALFDRPERAVFAACAGAAALVVIARGRGRVRTPAPAALALSLGALAGYAFAAALQGLPWTPRPRIAGGALAGVSVAARSPLFEALLYRERLLGAFRPLWGAPGAVLATSVLGAAAHVEPAAMAAPLLLGLANGALVVWTGSVALAVGVHAGWNLAALGVP